MEALAAGRTDALARTHPAMSPSTTAFGDRGAVETAIGGAHLVVAQVIRSQRTATAFMEPRAAIGSYDATRPADTR